ncbi:glutathione peroxidase [uncultured Phenylobacterium sp.]|uniref:glutathione peroxidase n=1 Tax=uncultured Phenylobacterium sp. TaxID=349273 RepID=UPI0025D96422|nr:redoxin domain-containing protein [uncultured Phenylobacterium sp.]
MTTAIQDVPLKTIDGQAASLGDYSGKVLLVVNVASKCGLTPQYEGLEKLYERYRDRGFEVLGFPANDFREQEPGSDAEIQSFCTTNFGVKFPMFSKITVTGADKHPLYDALTRAAPKAQAKPGEDFRARLKGFGIDTAPEPEVLWNFEKFLVNREGKVVGRFAPDVAPDDALVVQAVESELG